MVPMHAKFLGDSKDRYSPPALYVRNAIENKFFPADRLPPEWKI
jgi:hypothetical protein